MTENHYATLGLPVSVAIDLDRLEKSYRDLSKTRHPDQGGSAEAFQTLTTAREVLTQPVSRLRHFLSLKGHTNDSRGSLGAEISELFQPIAETLQSADTLIGTLEKAQTQLQKALLQADVISTQQAIGQRQNQLTDLQGNLLDQASDETPLEQLAQITRDLAFLQKWQSQLQSRFAQLWV